MATGIIPAQDAAKYQRDKSGSFTDENAIAHYMSGIGLCVPRNNGRLITLTGAKVFLSGQWKTLSVASGNYFSYMNVNQWFIVFTNLSSQSITLTEGLSYLVRLTGSYD